jgi:hypothetical protein
VGIDSRRRRFISKLTQLLRVGLGYHEEIENNRRYFRERITVSGQPESLAWLGRPPMSFLNAKIPETVEAPKCAHLAENLNSRSKCWTPKTVVPSACSYASAGAKSGSPNQRKAASVGALKRLPQGKSDGEANQDGG